MRINWTKKLTGSSSGSNGHTLSKLGLTLFQSTYPHAFLHAAHFEFTGILPTSHWCCWWVSPFLDSTTLTCSIVLHLHSCMHCVAQDLCTLILHTSQLRAFCLSPLRWCSQTLLKTMIKIGFRAGSFYQNIGLPWEVMYQVWDAPPSGIADFIDSIQSSICGRVWQLISIEEPLLSIT